MSTWAQPSSYSARRVVNVSAAAISALSHPVEVRRAASAIAAQHRAKPRDTSAHPARSSSATSWSEAAEPVATVMDRSYVRPLTELGSSGLPAARRYPNHLNG